MQFFGGLLADRFRLNGLLLLAMAGYTAIVKVWPAITGWIAGAAT